MEIPKGTVTFVLVSVAALLTPSLSAEQASRSGDAAGLPQFGTVKATMHAYFASLPNRQKGDLISQGDVQPIFAVLQQLGWVVEDQKEILTMVLSDQDFLVRTLRSQRGERFMRQVANDKLIYDRLNRIVRVQGGQRMLEDLIKLPDGATYAKADRARAVPGLLDLLPKNRSGKTREIRDYNKPTGKIYTATQLIDRLETSHRTATKNRTRSS